MSSDDLANALQFARANRINIHSLTVVRNGTIVLDAYFYPYSPEMRYDLASVTKSITSLLIGAAVSDGSLEGTDQHINSVASKAHEIGRDPYGLGWWLSSQIPSLFEAQGRGGQRISVIPDKNLVVVMTGGGFEPGDIGKFVLKAIRSDHALPTNKAAASRLENELRAISAHDKPSTFTLPPIAARISGRVYVLPDNRAGIKDFSISFNHSAQATIRLDLITGETITQPLGLDGVYRLKQDAHGAYSAGKAKWLSDKLLEIELNMLSRIDRLEFEVEFAGDLARISVSEPTQIGTIVLDGIAK